MIIMDHNWIGNMEIKLPPQETEVASLGLEDSPEGEMTIHWSILA